MNAELVVLRVEKAGDAWKVHLGKREANWTQALDAVVVDEATAKAFQALLDKARG